MKRTLSILFCLCAMTLIFSGCAANPAQAGVHSFELKDGTMEERGTEFPFPMNGIIAVPDTENAPVVFILHGSHAINDAKSDDYYSGFSYLAERLAKEGFVAVGINVNMVYLPEPIEGDPYYRVKTIFDSYYQALEKANKGDKLFAVDLTGRMDLSKINFAGHSQGGFYSMYLSKTLSSEGIDVVSNLLIAPSVVHPLEEGYVDVPSAVILPQYDGDVYSLEGYMVYQHAAASPERKNQISAAFLYGGNHNWFNTKLKADELYKYDNASYITPEEEQQFLSDYASDFFKLYNFNEGSQFQTLGEHFQEEHGIAVASTLFDPTDVLLADGKSSVHTNAGMTAENLIASLKKELNTVGPFRTPLNWDEPLPLCSLTWNAQGSATYSTDKIKAHSLIISLALDSSKCNNAAMEIVITDVKGNHVSRTISSESSNALHYYEGEVEGDYMPSWSAITPISSIEIDVSTLYEIQSVELRSISESGAIMLQSIRARAAAQ